MLIFDPDVESYVIDLYELLAERPKYANISHKEMPTIEEHYAFVKHHPYASWHILKNEQGIPVGSVYLTKNNEIGIAIFKDHQGNGYAYEAIKTLSSWHTGALYANVAPGNEVSQKLFKSLGFEVIQHTYKLER